MTDRNFSDGGEDNVVATFTDKKTGATWEITPGEVEEIISSKEGGQSVNDVFHECMTLDDSYPPGLIGIDLNLEPLEILEGGGLPLPATRGFNTVLKPGRYYGLYSETVSNDGELTDALDALTAKGADGLLIASSLDLLDGEGAGAVAVTLSARNNENGELTALENPPYEPIEGWLISTDGEGYGYVTVQDLIGNLLVFAGIQLTADKKGTTGEADIPSITTIVPKKADWKTDKLTYSMFDPLMKMTPEQLAFFFDDEGNGTVPVNMANSSDKVKGIEVIATYSISIDSELLDELGISKRLDPFDGRVYEALSTLWNRVTEKTGRDVFPISEIYKQMGHTKNPDGVARKRITDSLLKMMHIVINVDNLDESTRYNNYPHFTYHSQLLPMEFVTADVNGNITTGCVHLYAEPPMYTFARERGNVTSFDIALLQSPLSMTNKNIRITDYLRRQISWMNREESECNHKESKRGRNPKEIKRRRNPKITLEAIYDAAGIKSSSDRSRKRGDIEKELNHYVDCGFIKGFKVEPDGYTITPKPRKPHEG